MATEPDEPPEQRSAPQRLAISTRQVVSTPRSWAIVGLVLAGGITSTAPMPYGALGAAALVVVAYDAGRRK